MRITGVLLAVGLGLVVAGCGELDNREWMKVDQKYTTEEFQRDFRACSSSGKLDEECMKSRGWVAVNPTKADQPKAPDPLSQPAGRTGRR